MTTSERIAMINAKRTSINNAEAEKKNAQELLRSQLIAEVLSMRERIESVIAVGNALKEARLLQKNGWSEDKRLRPYGYEHEVIADGVTHHVGLWDYGPSNAEIRYVGIAMGGYCGNYDFVTDGVSVVSRYRTQGHITQPVPVAHLQQFLKEFPEYEKAFYAWVDETMK